MFTVFFLCNTAASILHLILDLRVSATIDATAMAIAQVCHIVWIAALNPQGEQAHLEGLTLREEYPKRVASLTRLAERRGAQSGTRKSIRRSQRPKCAKENQKCSDSFEGLCESF